MGRPKLRASRRSHWHESAAPLRGCSPRSPTRPSNSGDTKTRLLEEAFYTALLEQGAPEEAASLLWECARAEEGYITYMDKARVRRPYGCFEDGILGTEGATPWVSAGRISSAGPPLLQRPPAAFMTVEIGAA